MLAGFASALTAGSCVVLKAGIKLTPPPNSESSQNSRLHLKCVIKALSNRNVSKHRFVSDLQLAVWWFYFWRPRRSYIKCKWITEKHGSVCVRIKESTRKRSWNAFFNIRWSVRAKVCIMPVAFEYVPAWHSPHVEELLAPADSESGNDKHCTASCLALSQELYQPSVYLSHSGVSECTPRIANWYWDGIQSALNHSYHTNPAQENMCLPPTWQRLSTYIYCILPLIYDSSGIQTR